MTDIENIWSSSQLGHRTDPDGIPAVRSVGLLPGRYARALVVGGESHRVTLHVGPVELLRNLTVLVASLAPTTSAGPSLASALHRAAAHRDATGRITDDVLARELAGRAPTGPLRPGTVIMTSSGELARQGIRRVVHAAALSPTGVDAATVATTVLNVFAAVARERRAEPDLVSVGLPLFGSGGGAITGQQSLDWIWPALARVLATDPTWEVHLVTHDAVDLELDRWVRVDGLLST